jgi:hypothetical protein
MKKYIAIYFAPREKLDEWMHMSQAEQEAGMDGWNTWGAAHKDALVDFGAPVGKNKRVMAAGITDSQNEVCGYTIVQADSHDAAAKIFTDSPHLTEGNTWVDVLEIMPMSDMEK